MRYIETYLHQNKIGVVLELETADEIALRCQEFRELAYDLALQIAATNPVGIDARQMASVLPPNLRSDETGMIDDALLEQDWIKDESITVRELINAVEDALKTSIRITRFTRFDINDN